MKDEVNNPEHYTAGGIECIDAIQAALTPEEFRGFLKGNILKYTWRERHTGGVQSLEKAEWYLKRLISKHQDLPTIHNRRKMDHTADAFGLVAQAKAGPYEADAFDKIEAHHFWKERA